MQWGLEVASSRGTDQPIEHSRNLVGLLSPGSRQPRPSGERCRLYRNVTNPRGAVGSETPVARVANGHVRIYKPSSPWDQPCRRECVIAAGGFFRSDELKNPVPAIENEKDAVSVPCPKQHLHYPRVPYRRGRWY